MRINNKNNKTIILLKYFNVIQTVGVFLVLFIFLSVMLPNFCSLINMGNLVKQLATTLLLAASMTIILIAGEIDISVGSVLGLAGIVGGIVVKEYGIVPGYIAGVGVGLGFGLFNGLVTVKGRIPSFITTLGTMLMARSLCYVASKGLVIGDFPDGFALFGQREIFGVPFSMIIVILLYLLIYIILKNTKLGQHIYAVGSNTTASMLSGINVDRTRIKAFVINGMVAGLAGILTVSRVMAIGPDSGRGLEFEVIAGVIIGGTSLKGGEGNVLQSIIGVLIIGMIRNGLNMSHLNIFWNDFVTGAVIVAAVLLDSFRKYAINKIEEKRYIKQSV